MTRCPANVVETSLPDLVVLCRNLRPDDREQLAALFGDVSDDSLAAMIMLKSGPKFTVLNEQGMPVCAGGYEPVADGVMQSWMIGNDEGWTLHWRTLTKAARWMMDTLLEGGVRRLQTMALASRSAACRWYTGSLKMQPEGVMRGFGRGGEDVAIFSRLAGE
jgi:hypothetical protein